MKHFNTILIATLALFSGAFAQPTLNSGVYNFNVGEIFTYQYVDVSNYSPGPSGANQTWNFTGIPVDSAKSQEVKLPASAPGGSNFPNATYAFQDLTSIDGNDGSVYFGVSNDVVSYHGFNARFNDPLTGAPQSQNMIYTDIEEIFRFPFSYQDTASDAFFGAQAIPAALTTIYRYGTGFLEYDGYGTLVLDNGTYNDVIRLSYSQSYVDSTVAFSIPFVGPYYESVNYYWVKAGEKVPLFQHTVLNTISIVFFDTTVSTLEYGIIGTLGVSNEEPLLQSPLEIFPNPASDQVTISFSPTSSLETGFEIIDMQGRPVEVIPNRTFLAGENKIRVDVSEYKSGIYLIKPDDDKIQPLKFVVK